MYYLIAKAIHVILIIPWIASLAYISRLLIPIAKYGTAMENRETIEKEHLVYMTGRILYRIAWPAAILAILSGTSIMHLHFQSIWFWIKLVLVFGLLLYHILLHTVFVQLKNDKSAHSITKLNMISEMGILFMAAIVMLAVLKGAIHQFIVFAGIVGLIFLLYLGVRTFLFRSADRKL